MRLRIMAVGLVLAALSACNSRNAITENRQSPQSTMTMADVVPVPKPTTPEARQQQQRFLVNNTKRFKSRKKASVYYIAQAKRNYNEQKLDSAAYLFGRAWLLDSTNQAILRGYGLVYGQQKQYDKALFVLYKALEKDKENARLLTDIATTHLGRFYKESNPADLLQSKKLLEKAMKYSPDAADIYYKLAINSYYLQEYNKAWSYLHRSLNKDQGKADKTFIAALLEKQQDPEGKYLR